MLDITRIISDAIVTVDVEHDVFHQRPYHEWTAAIERNLYRHGLVIIPRTPTEIMSNEGADFLPTTPSGTTAKCAENVYKMMVEAWEIEQNQSYIGEI